MVFFIPSLKQGVSFSGKGGEWDQLPPRGLIGGSAKIEPCVTPCAKKEYADRWVRLKDAKNLDNISDIIQEVPLVSKTLRVQIPTSMHI